MTHAVKTPVPARQTAESSQALLRRQCKCGTHGVAGTTCQSCQERENGHPEGDFDLLRRSAVGQAAGGDEPFGVVPPIVYEVLHSPGQALAEPTRTDMEGRFGGADFSRVRVHTDAKASASAEAVNANAYTVGRNIVFGRGQYAPTSHAGRSLLAHELAHTAQQPAALTPSRLTIDPPHSSSERQAETVGRTALRENAVQPSGDSGPAAKTSSAQVPAVATPLSRQAVQRQERSLFDQALDVLSSENRQFVRDLVDSVRQAPNYAAEILVGEVWEAIQAHWIRFTLLVTAFVAAEIAVAALTAAPEPLVTKAIAGILQIVLLLFALAFAAVEVFGAFEEGINWVRQCRQARGNPQAIASASRSFLRMVRHIIFAVLNIIGARAKIRGIRGGAGPAGAGGAGGTAAEAAERGGAPAGAGGPPPSNVVPLRPGQATGPVAQGPVRFPTAGSGALKPQEVPFEEPVPQSGVRPVPEPVPKAPPVGAGRGPAPRTPLRIPVVPSPALPGDRRGRKEDKCTYTEGFPLGGNKEHDALARKVTGKPVEYTVRAGKYTARFDGMDDIGTLYEIKTRHDFLNLLDQPAARLGPGGRRVFAQYVPGLIAQVENQRTVAAICKREFRLATNNLRVVGILRELFPDVPVEYVPFSFETEDR